MEKATAQSVEDVIFVATLSHAASTFAEPSVRRTKYRGIAISGCFIPDFRIKRRFQKTESSIYKAEPGHNPGMAFALVMRPIGAPDLLLYLLRNGRTMNTKIIEDMGLSTDTFYDARNKLIDLGYADP